MLHAPSSPSIETRQQLCHDLGGWTFVQNQSHALARVQGHCFNIPGHIPRWSGEMIAGNRRTVGATSDDVTGAREPRSVVGRAVAIVQSCCFSGFDAGQPANRFQTPTSKSHPQPKRFSLSRGTSSGYLPPAQAGKAHPHTGSPKRKRSGNTPAIRYAAGGNDRNSNGVTHEWD